MSDSQHSDAITQTLTVITRHGEVDQDREIAATPAAERDQVKCDVTAVLHNADASVKVELVTRDWDIAKNLAPGSSWSLTLNQA